MHTHTHLHVQSLTHAKRAGEWEREGHAHCTLFLISRAHKRLLHLYLLDLCGCSFLCFSLFLPCSLSLSFSPSHLPSLPLSVYLLHLAALDPFPFLFILCVLLIWHLFHMLPASTATATATDAVYVCVLCVCMYVVCVCDQLHWALLGCSHVNAYVIYVVVIAAGAAVAGAGAVADAVAVVCCASCCCCSAGW